MQAKNANHVAEHIFAYFCYVIKSEVDVRRMSGGYKENTKRIQEKYKENTREIPGEYQKNTRKTQKPYCAISNRPSSSGE